MIVRLSFVTEEREKEYRTEDWTLAWETEGR